MRYGSILFGMILLIRGMKHCIAQPAVFHYAGSAYSTSSAYSRGFAAGEATGSVIATLLILTVGVLLCTRGWPHRRSSMPSAPTP